MKQITQNLSKGNTTAVDVPIPRCREGNIMVQTINSLISSGTERMLVDFGKSNYFQKAKQQPDKVKEVIQKVKTDGLMTTYEAVKSKLDQPMPIGYCNVGRVVAVGDDISEFRVGDIVASNGPHAEYVCVHKNLCAKVPIGVSSEQSVFTVLAAISLQSVRLAKPEIGEVFVVSGLGLVGLLTVQFLRANGCKVIGIDYNKQRLALSASYGAITVNLSEIPDPINHVKSLIEQPGVDGVIIAAATKSNDPVHQAAEMCRQRGRIILVGVAGLDLSRADFYEKELTFQVSCSYGPGRYDSNYEDNGIDYPFGYVRWTEQRNFKAVLDTMKEGWLKVDGLITHRFKVEEVEKAYDVVLNEQSALGIVLEYPSQCDSFNHDVLREMQTVDLDKTSNVGKTGSDDKVNIAVIGAGNYASRMLIPSFSKCDPDFNIICANTGVNCQYMARKFGFKKASTDTEQIWNSDNINLVVIATRHNSHARYVCNALAKDKHVFVEKPLAITMAELDDIEESYRKANGAAKLMVGFNRRFSPFVQKMKKLLTINARPMSIMITVNAGHMPADHWTQDQNVGGGRIIGEACHFIDLARFLSGAKIVDSHIMYLGGENHNCYDNAVIQLSFSDGSVASINYLANGHKSVVKERIEVFSDGKILQLTNFRRLVGYGWKGFKKISSFSQDKGQDQCVRAFVDSIQRNGPSPIPFDEIIEVSRICIKLAAAD